MPTIFLKNKWTAYLKCSHFSFRVWKMQMCDQHKFYSNFLLLRKMKHGGVLWRQLHSWLLANDTGWEMVVSVCTDQNCRKQYPHTNLSTWQPDSWWNQEAVAGVQRQIKVFGSSGCFVPSTVKYKERWR